MDITALLNPQTPQKRTNSKFCDRDTHYRIQTLKNNANWGPARIVKHIPGLTLAQVKYALSHRTTPQKQRCGRRPLLDTPTRKALVHFVSSSRANRRIPWPQIPQAIGWHDCKLEAIENAFEREGYGRWTALKKPDLTQKHADARLTWALQHRFWTWEQWAQILWTDESWVKPGGHKKVKITRKAGEALLPACVEPKVQRKIGWMFWGSISGLYGKGPGLFWEKDWGTITSASYCEHVLPIVEQYARGHLYFMQDNAAAHGARATRAEIKRRGLHMIFWPALSPDLNPIETMWD